VQGSQRAIELPSNIFLLNGLGHPVGQAFLLLLPLLSMILLDIINPRRIIVYCNVSL
jgi:hypothetical protein